MSAARKDSESEISDWGRWANHVLAELKRLNESIEDIRKELNVVNMDVVTLKIKSGIWGSVAGAVTVIAILGFDFVKENMFTAPARPQIQYQMVPYNPNANSAATAPVSPSTPASAAAGTAQPIPKTP